MLSLNLHKTSAFLRISPLISRKRVQRYCFFLNWPNNLAKKFKKSAFFCIFTPKTGLKHTFSAKNKRQNAVFCPWRYWNYSWPSGYWYYITRRKVTAFLGIDQFFSKEKEKKRGFHAFLCQKSGVFWQEGVRRNMLLVCEEYARVRNPRTLTESSDYAPDSLKCSFLAGLERSASPCGSSALPTRTSSRGDPMFT